MNRVVRTMAGSIGTAMVTAAVLAVAQGPAAGVTLPAASSQAGSAEAGSSDARAAVPSLFKATSLTWISPQQGWVLGSVRCGTNACTDVIKTADAGKTWQLAGTIHAAIPQIGNPGTGVTEIRFATAKFGWSYGPDLYRSSNGGQSWTRQQIPGSGKQILSLATTATTTYAVVSQCAFASGLCGGKPLSLWRASTATGQPWTKIPLTLPANNVADVAARGSTVYVIDAQRNVNGRMDKFYASTDGRTFQTRPVPCDNKPDIALVQAVPTSATHVALLCVGNLGSPQPGSSTKYAYRSANTGRTDAYAGTMPSAGTFTIQLAASPGGHLAATAASGGSFIYTNNSATTWHTPVFFGDGGRGWNDIVYLTDTVGWVVYSPAAFFHGSGKLYSTRDAGLSWHVVTP
jgi:hypothetical protein